MTHSVNALLASSSSNNISCPDGKKSLFLLKKITELTKLGCKDLSDNVLNNKAGDLIDIYLSLPHQDSESVKKELQGLKLVRPNLGSYNLKKVFYAALSEVTGIDQSSLAKTQKIHLNQIYIEQFLTWIQEEIKQLPSSSILLLLHVYHSFGDPSIDLETSTWQELLSLKEWNSSQKKSLNQFKSKYESLNFHALKSPFIKIENIIHLVEATENIEKLKGSYILWNDLVELLVNHLKEEQKKHFVRSLNKNKKFIREGGKIPDKEFIIHARKMITGFLVKFEQVRKEYNKKISKNSIWIEAIQKLLKAEDDSLQRVQIQVERTLSNSLKKVDNEVQKIQKDKSELEDCLQDMQDVERKTNCFNVMGKEKQKLLCLIETKDQALQKISESREKLIKKNQETINAVKTYNLRNQKVLFLKRDEKDTKEIRNALILREKSFSSILFLSQWLINLLDKEDQLIHQLEQEKHIVYEAAIKKTEGSFKKHSTPLSKKTPAKKSSSLAEDFSITSENTSGEESEEELVEGSSSDSVLEEINPFNEIHRYLTQLKEGESTQLNGLLSQAIDSLLRPLQAHLLKTKPTDDLKALYELQTKEIYDHLLLGTAGLELVMQAAHDQRTDHIALGFRAALLHFYYAIEQKLSQKIILETNKILDKVDQDHNLLHLAQKAKIADIRKWERFLQEMTLHLTFSYPEDYRLFFQQGNAQKAFSLLDDLSSPNLNKKKMEEALEFCFEMYSRSIAFIIEISSAQIEDQLKLSLVIQELKKQIIRTLHESSVEKILLPQASVVQLKEPDPALARVQKCLSVLHLFLKDLNPLNSACERDQKIYAAIGTVQSYLKFIEISLEIPQNSSHHSLQKFIKVETMANVDKLFKHLFRAKILLEKGEDNHQHALTNLFTSVADFYQKDDEQTTLSYLKDINLGISHHYLHTRKNNSKLHLFYKESLVQASSLLNVSDEYTVFNKKVHKNFKKTAKYLLKNIDTINELMNRSLDLFMEFLEPTLEEIRQRLSITAVA